MSLAKAVAAKANNKPNFMVMSREWFHQMLLSQEEMSWLLIRPSPSLPRVISPGIYIQPSLFLSVLIDPVPLAIAKCPFRPDAVAVVGKKPYEATRLWRSPWNRVPE
jgi:hypothetical protein